MRTMAMVALVLCAACGAKNGNHDGGSGGGTSNGGGSAAGGGSATGGGSAAGGGAANGGGSATGGGSASGGGSGSFAIEFSPSCPAFAPCGGTPLSGAYTYTGICIDSNNPFPALSSGCSALVFQDLVGTAQGTLSFTGTDVTRAFSAHITGSVEVPEACAASGCSIIQQTLRSYFTSATCITTGDAGQTCGCTFGYDYGTTGTVAYTTNGSTLTTDIGTSTARSYDFCLSANLLSYREAGFTPHEPGVATLAK